jgi:hypothetical protein
MTKKRKVVMYLLIVYGLIILFLQTVYNYFYNLLPAPSIPTTSATYLQVEAFMEPNNLSIFFTIVFFVGIMLIALFESE